MSIKLSGTQPGPCIFVSPPAAFMLQWQSCVVASETIWPPKPMFTVWLFAENICWPWYRRAGAQVEVTVVPWLSLKDPCAGVSYQ